jgi:branched-subunit amino acid aminotransferase/4-amino-4-deoxychorismate lyase
MSIVYLDGQFLPESEAKIPVMNRGFLFGDGAYSTIQVKEGKACFLERHLMRLKAHSQSLGIEPPFVPVEAVERLIQENSATQGIWRLRIIVTGDENPLMRLPKRPYGHLILMLKPFIPPPYVPLRMGIFPIAIMHCHASFKSLAHLNRYYVMEYAHQQDLDDCLTKTEDGYLLEAAFGNIVLIQKEQVFTPDPKILPLHYGVTVTVILELLQKAGFEVNPTKIRIEDISDMSWIFRTNTMSGLRPIASIGGRDFTRNPELEGWILREYEKAMPMASPLNAFN